MFENHLSLVCFFLALLSPTKIGPVLDLCTNYGTGNKACQVLVSNGFGSERQCGRSDETTESPSWQGRTPWPVQKDPLLWETVPGSSQSKLWKVSSHLQRRYATENSIHYEKKSCRSFSWMFVKYLATCVVFNINLYVYNNWLFMWICRVMYQFRISW